jgi:hypothetical protein
VKQQHEIDDSEIADDLIACGSTSLIAWRLRHNTVMELPEADVDCARSLPFMTRHNFASIATRNARKLALERCSRPAVDPLHLG